MNKANRYSPEVRERVVQMVFEHDREYFSQWSAMCSLAMKIGCTPETLRSWVRSVETDQGRRGRQTTEDRESLKALEWENRELIHDAIYYVVDCEFSDREPMLQTVERLLQQLRNGFRFITIPELFKNGNPEKRNSYKKSDIQFLNSLKVQHGVGRQYVDKKSSQ